MFTSTRVTIHRLAQHVEPLAQQVEQRDRRELPEPLAIAGQAACSPLRSARRESRCRRTPCRPRRRPARSGPRRPSPRCRRRRRARAARPRPSRRAACSLTTDSAVTPSSERFTSVAYDADRAAERVARARDVDDARADEPAGQRLRDAERPARARAAVRAPRTPSSRRRRRRRGRRGSARSSFSSSSTNARASASVARLRGDAHHEPFDAAGEERDRRVAALRVERVEPVRDHLGQRRLRRAPRLQRASTRSRPPRPTAAAGRGSRGRCTICFISYGTPGTA